MIFDLVPDDRKVRAFSLSPSFIDQFKGKQPNWGYDGLGYFTYKRTYSRPTCDCVDPTKCNHPTEEFWQTCKRVVEGVYTIQKIHCRRFHLPWSGVKSQRSAQDMFQRMWDFKFLPPGRGLWMMGTDVVYERGAAALNNCGFTSTENIQIDFAGPFSFLMDMSMLGVGVGGDTRGAGKVRLSLPRLDDEPFVVEDSREGWVGIISTVLNSFVGKGQYPAIIDFQQVRKRGEPLKTFGGISSGPRPLIELIENLSRLLLPPNVEVLFSPWDPDDPTGPQLITTFKEVGDVEPYRITSSQIVDTFNYIGKAVVAGGIRRCLPKGTLVHTSTGLLPVEDVEPGMSVVSSDGYTKVTDWVAQGVQPITSITTQMGSFECTDKHKIAVVSDTKGGYSWKKAFELEPGDRMVFVDHVVEGSLTNLPPYKYDPPAHSTTCKDINIPKLDPKMAWFFGMFHGDGYVTSPLNKGHVSVVVALGQESLLFRVQEQLERFGIHVGVLNPVEGNQCYKAQVSSKQLAAYLGQFKQAKEVLVIPGFVMQGLPEIRAAYVAGLFDADGSCRNRPLVVASSVYPSYLRQVQSVLASLGVPSRFSLHKDKNRVPNGWQPLYKLTIVGEKALQRWEERVAPFALKYEDLRKSSRSGNDYGFPSKMALEDGVTGYHDGSMVWSRTSRQITVARLGQVTGQDVNLVPVEVLGVEHGVREDETFDISTEAHEFVAQGGYLVHNTAEIMFGDHDDHDFVTLKQDKGALKDRRWASNNSIWGTVGMDYGEVAESIAKNGEPGIIWLENAQAFSRMNGIADWKDRRAKGANPCFVGDTLIATADGRGAVPIRQLVEEKNDVPVYSMDPKTGKVEIKMGRNPRLTRESSPLVEVELDDGSTFRVTPDHKMVLLDGTHCDAEDLQPGDSLPGFQKGAGDLEGEARWSKAFSEASKGGHRAGDRVSDPVFFAKLLKAHTVIEGEDSSKHMSSQRRAELLAYYKEQEAKTDLETVWMGERLYAVRSCELCGEEFVMAWGMRGQSFCSWDCLNKADSHIQEHQAGQDVTQDYNHRVKAVRPLDVEEPVYNLSVTKHHTVCVVTGGTPKGQRSGIFTSNCVEQTLEDRELCCVSGDIRITTRKGAPRISDVVGQEVDVWNGVGWSTVTPFVAGRNKKIYRVHLSDGSYLDCTDDHKWDVRPEGKRKYRQVETRALEIGSRVSSFEISVPCEGDPVPFAFEWGFFTGDGYLDNGKVMAALHGKKDRVLEGIIHGSLYKPQQPDGYAEPFVRVNFTGPFREVFPKDYLERARALNNKREGLPDWVFKMDRESTLRFIAGWVDADGNVSSQVNTDNYRVFGTEQKMRDLQVLLRRVGVDHASVYLMARAGETLTINKRDVVRNHDLWVCLLPSYECAEVSRYCHVKKANRFGSRYVTNNAHPEGAPIDRARKQRVVNIEETPGKHTTYCFTEPERHMGVFGNVLTYQCLVETFPAHHDDLEDYKKTLKTAYLYAKSVTLIPTHNPKTNAVLMRNRRIGCSMSGIQQAKTKLGHRHFLSWADSGYQYIQDLDTLYSEWLCIPRSIKTTSVKPSGCRPWYALTSTDKGLFTLEDLFEHHPVDQEWADMPGAGTFEGPVALRSGPISKTYNNGVSPVLRITTSYGIEVESTPNHQWWVSQRYGRKKYQDVNAWRRADEIQPGDILDIQPGTYNKEGGAKLAHLSSLALNMRGDAKEIQQPEYMNPSLAWMLGYLWGDGAMSPLKYRLRWIDARRENLEKVQRVLKDQFGLETKIHQASEHRKAETLEVGSKHLWHWLIRNDVFKLYADKIDVIPKVVRASGQEEILAFLAGLLDSDGWAGMTEQGAKLVWTMADKFFAQHVQDVALAVGLVLGRSHITGGSSFQERKSMYHLTQSVHVDKRGFELFRRHSTKVASVEARSDFPGWHCLKDRARGGLILGKVTKVEPAGVMPTFDVEVAGDHWYYAGAVKSHNTVSLLAGATPGIHYPHSEYYIRNIRVKNTSSLVDAARDAGYFVEADVYADDTSVISFPVSEKHFTKGKRDVSIWEQFADAAALQRHWADNQVSCTVSFSKEEADAGHIARCLEVYEDQLKAISLLPLDDHGYEQAPYIEIDEATYKTMHARIKPLRLDGSRHEVTDKFCDGETCEIDFNPNS